MANHFWVGSLCLFQGRALLPSGIISVADAITIVEDLGNRIPDKSWMLYLLEVFDRRIGVPAELNLICQFNDRDNFWAIFSGVNRYKFTEVLPAVGHTYLRQIIFQKQSQAIEFVLTDRTAGKSEKFVFNVTGIAFEGKSHFTGVEWWNKVASHTFPVRYRVDVSELKCGIAGGQGITYLPYDGLVPNKDSSASSYPVSFVNPEAGQGSLSYGIADGMTGDGPDLAKNRHATL
ncbi:MAG: hypothetical protein ACRD99_06685 [Nitrososphaera sp.]